MEILALLKEEPMDVEIMDYVSRTEQGAAAFGARSGSQKQFRKFMISIPNYLRQQEDMLTSFLGKARGTNRVWFDGGNKGDIQNPQLVDIADGVSTQYMIPYNNVFGPSSIVLVNGVIVTNWTITESTGLLVFTAPPAVNARIEWYGRRKVRCIIVGTDTSTLYKETEVHSLGVYDAGKLVLQEVNN